MFDRHSATKHQRALTEAIERYTAKGYQLVARTEFEVRLVKPRHNATFMQQLVGQAVERVVVLRINAFGEVEEMPE